VSGRNPQFQRLYALPLHRDSRRAVDRLPKFGERSRVELATCDQRLVDLFLSVVQDYDCTIIQGARTAEQQAENVRTGVSKTLDSKHVTSIAFPLARAVDVAPYPVIWPKPEMSRAEFAHAVGRFYHFGCFVQLRAKSMGIALRWGADWDSDGDFLDQTFDDLPHFELVG
jgi:peptidoglycan LD-endopeptidase CwlK